MAREMKDSGVEWIGKIPTEWELKPLKMVLSCFGRIGFRGYTQEDLVDEGEGPITLSPTNIIDSKLSLEKCSYISWDKYYESPEIMLNKGDIVFVKTASVGKCAIYDSDEKATVNPQFVVLKDISCDKKFLFYSLISPMVQTPIALSNFGSVIGTITQKQLLSYKICIPSLSEQACIASFLDTECSRIDSVIERTRASIEEYKKLKQAVITQAVTKGIRPNREMKDSGIDVIKYLPSDWYVYAIKHLCSQPITDGTHLTPDYSDAENGSPFLSSKDISTGYIDWKNIKYITKELHVELQKRIAPQFEDILLAKNGTTGIAAIVESNKTFDVYVTIAVIRVDKQRVLPKFLLYSINSLLCKHQFDEHLKGIGVPNLHLGTINNTKVFLPSIEEQKLIVLYLDEKISKLDLLIKKKTLLLDTLESYKKSLIFEYVTGKKEVI